MLINTQSDVAEEIVELLNDERTALLSGNTEALQKITSRKQKWIDSLPTKPLDLDLEHIRKIKNLSDQNAALSESCQVAQKSVIRRLSEIQNIQNNSGIYSDDGRFSSPDNPIPTVEKRA